MSIQDILRAIEDIEATPAARGIELRVSFSKFVIRKLKELGWTQKKLAQECGKKESYVSRVLNGDQNLSFDSAGDILFALSAKACFIEEPEAEDYWISSPIVTGWTHVEEEAHSHAGTRFECRLDVCEGTEHQRPRASTIGRSWPQEPLGGLYGAIHPWGHSPCNVTVLLSGSVPND